MYMFTSPSAFETEQYVKNDANSAALQDIIVNWRTPFDILAMFFICCYAKSSSINYSCHWNIFYVCLLHWKTNWTVVFVYNYKMLVNGSW